LLVVNQRMESIRYEPLEQGENLASFNRMRSLDWKRWRYSAIVIPGAGLNSGETGLSPTGFFHLRMAARRWREGMAPFILVSGGHEHPNRTPYDEAIEMKRELRAHYSIPADAIIVDPYARHTTTNIRNAVRLLFRMGAPLDKDFVVTSIVAASLRNPDFGERCALELGYQPVKFLDLMSPFDVTAHGNVESLHIDARDPLDP